MNKIDLSELNLQEKEEKILQAAIKLFSQKGFRGATSKEIALEAGVAEGTIFKYFKTKKDILNSILLNIIHIISDKIILKGVKEILLDENEKDIKTILKKIIYDRMKKVDQYFPMMQVIIIEAIYHENIRLAIYNEVVKKAIDLFSHFYQQKADSGVLKKDIDPLIAFRSILGNIGLFIAQKKILGQYNNSNNKIDEEIDKVIDIILKGIEA